MNRSVASAIAALLAAFSLTIPASAGRNSNGALVVHTDDAIIYTPSDDYCRTAAPATCEELVTTSNDTSDEVTLIWLMAAFRQESNPAVTTIQFGIHHDLPAGQNLFVRYNVCGPGPLELPDQGWPETGFGDLIAYSGPVFDRVFPFYWFAVYHEVDGDFFGTRTYPSTNEAVFVDDGNPPVEDLIYNFGTIRWEAPGENQCPTAPVGEACCFEDGTCQYILPSECDGQGGAAQGPGTTCQPNPCPVYQACCFDDGSCQVLPPETCLIQGGQPQGAGTSCDPNECAIGETGGACCFEDGHCEFVAREVCEELGGIFQGIWTFCEYVHCETTPVLRTTWGDVKLRFR